jgi:hypothetical protein
MNAFRFRLEKVLEWRRTRLELEEANYRRHVAILAELDRQCAQLEAAAEAAERQVRAWNPVAGRELDALGTFRLHMRRRETEMAIPRTEARRRVAAQQAVMLEARRRLRLLERLKDRRLAEWTAARDKELEDAAAEGYLARWKPDRQ